MIVSGGIESLTRAAAVLAEARHVARREMLDGLADGLGEVMDRLLAEASAGRPPRASVVAVAEALLAAGATSAPADSETAAPPATGVTSTHVGDGTWVYRYGSESRSDGSGGHPPVT